MKSSVLVGVGVLAGLMSASSARAWDPPGARPGVVLDGDGPRVVLHGELEVEVHDLSGKGGPGFDSATDTRTVYTRSPYGEIDAGYVSGAVEVAPDTAATLAVDLDPLGARLVIASVDWRRVGAVTHELFAGFDRPAVALDRRTERYPLIASSYWRSPALHVRYDASSARGRWRVHAGGHAGFLRPLGSAPVQDSTAFDTTIRVLAWAPGRPMPGVGPEVGAWLGGGVGWAFVEGFVFAGRLGAEGGTDALRSEFPTLSDPGADRATGWAGARVGFDGAVAHTWAEAIVSREGPIHRAGGYAQGSVTIPLRDGPFLASAEPLLRGEVYTLPGAGLSDGGGALRSPAPSNAVTWDYAALTAAVAVDLYAPTLRARLEYAVIRERNGVPDLALPNTPFPNDEWLVQLEAGF